MCRKAGAVEALVKLLEGAEDAFVAKGALGAISSLVQGNPTNKLAVREANGIEVCFVQLGHQVTIFCCFMMRDKRQHRFCAHMYGACLLGRSQMLCCPVREGGKMHRQEASVGN